jgi:CRISPR-associated protein Cst1
MIDVGIATLCAAAEVDDPKELTPAAIDAFTEEMVNIYLNPAMSGFLSYVVFANARFANPAQLKPEFDAKRRKILSEVVNLWKEDSRPSEYEQAAYPGEKCAFSGDDAKVRVSRIYIPMTTDERNMNFVPEGVPLMPISGWCLLALMAMPLGGLASKGKMWIVHSFDAATTQFFAGRNLVRNRQDFQMQGLAKRPNYKFARTYLLRDLMDAYVYGAQRARYPLTAYLFTSAGQKSEVDIMHLSLPALQFVRKASLLVPESWNQVVQRAERKNTAMEDKEGQITYHERNYFYEDLFDLPENAHTFLWRYLLRMPIPTKPTGDAKDDPRFTYSFIHEANLVSWTLTELFLKEVMNMNKARIETIKVIADNITEYIHKVDERLFKELFNARSDYDFRLALIKADKRASVPLFDTDQYVLAFFTETDMESLVSDWRLARDLMLIRIIERLYQLGEMQIAQNAVIEEAEAETK